MFNEYPVHLVTVTTCGEFIRIGSALYFAMMAECQIFAPARKFKVVTYALCCCRCSIIQVKPLASIFQLTIAPRLTLSRTDNHVVRSLRRARFLHLIPHRLLAPSSRTDNQVVHPLRLGEFPDLEKCLKLSHRQPSRSPAEIFRSFGRSAVSPITSQRQPRRSPAEMGSNSSHCFPGRGSQRQPRRSPAEIRNLFPRFLGNRWSQRQPSRSPAEMDPQPDPVFSRVKSTIRERVQICGQM
jgi:hypothetical protein